MTRIGWTLADLAARLLEPHEREAVRGDLAECGASEWRTFREVLGLVVRRQAALWKAWRPWFALVGVVLPLGILLSHASRWWAVSSAHDISLYVRVWDWSYLGYPGWRREFFASVWSAALSAAALSVWSWTCGYMLASVSRRTVWVAATAFAVVVFLCHSWNTHTGSLQPGHVCRALLRRRAASIVQNRLRDGASVVGHPQPLQERRSAGKVVRRRYRGDDTHRAEVTRARELARLGARPLPQRGP